MKNLFKKSIIFGLMFLFLVSPAHFVLSDSVASRVKGKILLAVQANGEAWYVHPGKLIRYYLGRPADAFRVMREQGVGITDIDLNRIPIGAVGVKLSAAGGSFVENNKGKIFLQVQANGEAWYVNPADGRRYFLGRPADAFAVMRGLGLGITNADLAAIPAADVLVPGGEETPISEKPPVLDENGYDLRALEKDIHTLINQERTSRGLDALVWNDDAAAVAREHSVNLAKENEPLTSLELTCDFPLIHHEGFDFGTYHSDRLDNRGIYYPSESGENIALISAVARTVTYKESEYYIYGPLLKACPDKQTVANESIKKYTEDETMSDEKKLAAIREEIDERLIMISQEKTVKTSILEWTDSWALAKKTVDGWMNSPGHRANILKESYDEAGVGVDMVKGYLISTQIFVKRASCGFKTGQCCQETRYVWCYEPYECGNGVCK